MIKKIINKNIILDIFSGIIVNMIVIIISTKMFKNIYVDGNIYIFLVSILMMIFNKCIKPILNIIMLPLNIFTLGLTYPLINIIILKIISIFLGEHFIVNGFLSLFFMSIFISIITLLIDKLIGQEIRKV